MPSRKVNSGSAPFSIPPGHHVASWRHPDSQADAGVNFRHYAEMAQTAERAKFDMVFLADNICVREAQHGGTVALGAIYRQFRADHAARGPGGRHRAHRPRLHGLDQLQRAVPRRPQVRLARPHQRRPDRDGISSPRAWRPRPTISAAMPHYGHAERYDRAREFAEIVLALWDSWDDDAFPRDKASGLFFDPAKLHTLDHPGQALQGEGPAQRAAPAAGPSGDRAGRHVRRRHGCRRALRRGDFQRAADDGGLARPISKRSSAARSKNSAAIRTISR